MIKLLRNFLKKIIDDIDAGNSNISEEDTTSIMQDIGELMARYKHPKEQKEFNRIESCKYLRISESKFNYLRNNKLISNGHKKAGDVRKWKKEELDEYIERNKK